MKILKILAALSPFGEYYYFVSGKSKAESTGFFKGIGKLLSIAWLVYVMGAFIMCLLLPIPVVNKLVFMLFGIIALVIMIVSALILLLSPIVLAVLLYQLSKISKEDCSKYELKFFKYKKFQYIALLTLVVAFILGLIVYSVSYAMLPTMIMLLLVVVAGIAHQVIWIMKKINLYKII